MSGRFSVMGSLLMARVEHFCFPAFFGSLRCTAAPTRVSDPALAEVDWVKQSEGMTLQVIGSLHTVVCILECILEGVGCAMWCCMIALHQIGGQGWQA